MRNSDHILQSLWTQPCVADSFVMAICTEESLRSILLGRWVRSGAHIQKSQSLLITGLADGSDGLIRYRNRLCDELYYGGNLRELGKIMKPIIAITFGWPIGS